LLTEQKTGLIEAWISITLDDIVLINMALQVDSSPFQMMLLDGF
jgi:hypothetical protein